MDDFFIDEINKLARQKDHDYLRGQEALYVLYNPATGTKYPAIDRNGCASVFTKREYAQEIIDENEMSDLKIQTLAPREFDILVKDWYRLGVVKFRVNPGATDHSETVNRDEYLPDEKAKMWDYAGSSLNSYTLRYKQNKDSRGPGNQAAAMTFWSMICHVLHKSLLLAPFAYAGEDPQVPVEDAVVHVTPDAAAAVRKRHQHKPADHAEAPLLFYGAEDYVFPSEADLSDNGAIRIRQMDAQGKPCLTAFTDFKALEAVCGRNVRVGLFTYGELRVLAGQSGAGLVVNPGDTDLLLTPETLEAIDEEKGSGPKFYVNLSDGRPAKPVPTAPQPEGKEEAAPPEEALEKAPVKAPKSDPEKRNHGWRETLEKLLAKLWNLLRKDEALPVCLYGSLFFGLMAVSSLGTLVFTQAVAMVLGVLGYRLARKQGKAGAMGAAGAAMGFSASHIFLVNRLRIGGLFCSLGVLLAILVCLVVKRKK